MKASTELCRSVSKAVFEVLRDERKKAVDGWKFQGTVYSEKPPGWLNVAMFLGDMVSSASGTLWSHSEDFVALVQVSFSDCNKAIAKEKEKGSKRDDAWLEELYQIKAKLQVWLTFNNFHSDLNKFLNNGE